MCQRDADVFDDVQPVPLVVHHDDLALQGFPSVIAHLLAEVAVESPLQFEGVLCQDERFVGIAVGDPLAVNLHLCARDVEDDALVVALAEQCCTCGFYRGGETRWHEVFLEKARRIDELEWLSFWLTFIGVISISISI